MKTNVKKARWKLAAEVKTVSDYALMLTHEHNQSETEANSMALEFLKERSDTFFNALLARNEDLFKTGEINLQF